MSSTASTSLQGLKKELVNSKYYLNIRSGYMAPVTLHCSYGDSGETITFYIFDGGEELDLTGSAVTVHGTRIDGANFGPFACTVSGNSVSFKLQTSMTAIEGSSIAELTISKTGSTIGTCNFGILVEKSAFPNGVAYDTDPSVYQDILKYVQSVPAALSYEISEKVSNLSTDLNNKIAKETSARQSGDSTNTSAIAVERARIDNYLSSGTAATNSELVDIRVAQDGITYTSAGESVREQIKALRNAGNGYYPVGMNLSLNKYINHNDGTLNNYNGWAATDYIPIKPNQYIHVDIAEATTYCALYDANKNYVWAVSWDADGSDWVIPVTGVYANTAYMRISQTIENIRNMKVYLGPDPDKEFDDSLLNMGYLAHSEVIGGGIRGAGIDGLYRNEVQYYNHYASCIIKKNDTYRDSKIADVNLTPGRTYILTCGWMLCWDNTSSVRLYVKYGDDTVQRLDVTRDNNYKIITIDKTKTVVQSTLYLVGINNTDTPASSEYKVTAYGISIILGQFLLDNHHTRPISYANIALPPYFESNVTEAIARINDAHKYTSYHGDSFFFITDTHFLPQNFIDDDYRFYTYNTINSITLIRYMIGRTGVSKILGGGDFVNSSPNGVGAELHCLNILRSRFGEDKANFYPAIGNHEWYTDLKDSSKGRPTEEQLYGAFLKYNEDNIVAVGPNASYAFDNVAQKVRYFIISCGRDCEATTSQAAWFMSELKNVPANYHIVVMGHAFLIDQMNTFRGYHANMIAALDAVKAKGSYTFDGVTYDYSTLQNVEVVAVFTGHTHVDGMLESSGGVKCISTTCDSWQQNFEFVDGQLVNVERTYGTKDEQAFDVVQIDFTNKKIYMTRVGYGSNREFLY